MVLVWQQYLRSEKPVCEGAQRAVRARPTYCSSIHACAMRRTFLAGTTEESVGCNHEERESEQYLGDAVTKHSGTVELAKNDRRSRHPGDVHSNTREERARREMNGDRIV